METDKAMFKFFNKFIFLDLSEGVAEEINILRKHIINRFRKTVPASWMLTVLSLIDDIILKLYKKELEGIQTDMYNLRVNVLYMLSWERFLKEDSIDES